MDKKQAAKSVLKKLSALRATLPDDEQIYLDQLVMGWGKAKAPDTTAGPEDWAADGTDIHPNPDSGNRSAIEYIRATAEISWNNIREVYELE